MQLRGWSLTDVHEHTHLFAIDRLHICHLHDNYRGRMLPKSIYYAVLDCMMFFVLHKTVL